MLEQLALPVFAGAVAACTLLLAVRGLAGDDLRTRFEPAARWLALLAGFVAGTLPFSGWPSLPPHDSVMWVPWLGAAGALVGLLLRKRRRWVVACAAGTTATLGAWLILRVLVPHAWTKQQLIAGVVATGAVTATIWWLSVMAARARRTGSLSVSAIPMAGITAAILLSGSVVLGLMAAAFTAAILAVELLSVRSGQPGLPEQSRGLVAMVAGTLLVGACAFASLPLSSAVLLALAPIGAATLLAFSNTRWPRTVAACASAGLCLAAVVLAWNASPPFYGV